MKEVAFVPPLAMDKVPAVTSPTEEAERAPERPTSFNPCDLIWRPFNVEVPVAPKAVAETPWNVEEAEVEVAEKFVASTGP